MKFIKKQAFIIAALFVSACSKETDDANNAPEKRLIGAWQWERTDGGIGNHIHDTPGSTGKQVVLKMFSDSTYSIYTNNAPTLQGRYTLETKTCIHDQTRKPYINFSAGPDMMVERLDNESLLLSDEAMDGVTSSYKRIANTAK